MKTMEELREQFDKEELIWVQKREKLEELFSITMNQIESYESFEDRMALIDTSIEIAKKMDRLDTKHKKFLLKWCWRFVRPKQLIHSILTK